MWQPLRHHVSVARAPLRARAAAARPVTVAAPVPAAASPTWKEGWPYALKASFALPSQADRPVSSEQILFPGSHHMQTLRSTPLLPGDLALRLAVYRTAADKLNDGAESGGAHSSDRDGERNDSGGNRQRGRTTGSCWKRVLDPRLTRGALALAVIAAFGEAVHSAAQLYMFSRKELRARRLLLCGGDGCFEGARAHLNECDSILTGLCRKSSSPLETIIFSPVACTLLNSFQPSAMLEQLQAHVAYHTGGLYLLASDASAASAEFARSQGLREGTYGTLRRMTPRDHHECRSLGARVLGRVGDRRARIEARDKAMREYEATLDALKFPNSYLRIRILNNVAIADFADGRDDHAIKSMRDAVRLADEYVSACELSAADAVACRSAVDLWLKEAAAAGSMADAFSGLSEPYKQSLQLVASHFRHDVVNSLIEGTLFGACNDRIAVEALELAKQGMRKALTARLTLVNTLALAERDTDEIVEALMDLVRTHDLATGTSFRTYLVLDRHWIARFGVGRTKLALGAALARLLELGACVDDEAHRIANHLASEWLTPDARASGGQRGAAFLWQARRAYAAGDKAAGDLNSTAAANVLKHRRERAEAANAAGSPREVRLEATALVIQARHPRSASAKDLVEPNPAQAAKDLLFKRGMDDEVSHPVSKWADDAQTPQQRDPTPKLLTNDLLVAMELLVRELATEDPAPALS